PPPRRGPPNKKAPPKHGGRPAPRPPRPPAQGARQVTPAATAPAFRASHRYARMAPRKARLVADLIRGLPVNAALRALDRSDKRAASLLGKVVRSAVANAAQDGNVDPNHLVV